MKIKTSSFILLFLAILTSLTFISCQSIKGAAKSGDLLTIKELIQGGEDVNAKDEQGWTPLLWAAYNNQPRATELLLKNGAKANHQSTMQFGAIVPKSTALHIASYYNFKHVVKQLLDNGADVNIVDSRGRTALIFASYYNFIDIVKLLVDKGADPNIKDNWKNTAITYAMQSNFYDVYELLTGKDIVTGEKIEKKDKK